MPLQIRRGTNAERENLASPPAQGELIWITDERKLYIGDGNTLLVNLEPVTGYSNIDARDAVADALDNGSHDYIGFTYNRGAGTIDASVDISNYDGVITASAFKGSVFADDGSTMGGTELVNAVDASINLDGTVKGHIIPDSNISYDLGSLSNRFRDLFLSGSSIDLGGSLITRNTTGGINIPAGSTVDGAPLEPTGGTGGNLNVNIVGDDSTIIVDSSTGLIKGTFDGDISGSVFGDDSTTLVDGITGTLFNGTIEIAGPILRVEDIGRIQIGDEEQQNGLTVKSYGTDPGVEVIAELTGTAGDGGAGLTQLGGVARLASWKGGFDTPTAAGQNDLLGQLQFAGYVNQGPEGVLQADLCAIKGLVDEVGDDTTNYAQGKLQFIIVDKTDIPNSRYAEFEGTQGVFSAPVFKPGSYANDTARDAAIPAPEAGMIIFNLRDDSTGVPQFQGYDGSNWVDLH